MRTTPGFLRLLLFLGLIASLFLYTPVSAATGTISLDKPFITTPGGTLQVTLSDTDLEMGQLQVNEDTDYFGDPYTSPALPFVGDQTGYFQVQKFPILDRNGDGAVNFLDVSVTSTGPTGANLRVAEVNGPNGTVRLRASGGVVNGGTTFKLTYLAADTQTTTVKVTSGNDITGFTLTLLETGVATGEFKGTFKTGTSTKTVIDLSGGVNEGPLDLDLNGDGDKNDTNVTFTTELLLGQDLNGDGLATATTTVQTINLNELPNFSVRPAVAALTGAIINVTYDDAGIQRVAYAVVETTPPAVAIISPLNGTATQTQSTRLIAEVTDADSGVDVDQIAFNIAAVDSVGNPMPGVGHGTPVSTETIANDKGYRIEVLLTGVPIGETFITWNVTAADKAGNVKTTDDYALKIDTVPPTFNAVIGAETGHYLDADGLLITDPTKAKRTSVRLIFNEALDGLAVNGGSISASDFEVNDIPPVAVDWSADYPESVFLTVPEMPSNQKPKIKVVGTIADKAGNEQAGGLSVAEATDGISPGLTVTVSPTLHKDKVTIDIAADETLLITPVVTVNGDGVGVGVGTGLTIPKLIGTNLFRSTFDPAGPPSAYTVKVDVRDIAANPNSKGSADLTSDDAILFEIDNAIPDPTFTLSPRSSIPTDSPLITIDWTAEGIEYGLDAFGNLTNVAADIVDDLDTHDRVALVNATLDGVDVLGQVSTLDDRVFVLTTAGLPQGERTADVTGVDEAGNENNVQFKFTVTNAAPVVEAGPDLAVDEGSTLTLDQTTFTDANLADTHTATIDWGDGVTESGVVAEVDGSGSVTGSHVYTDDDGSPFTVMVSVTDNSGVSHSDTLQVTVNNVDPVVQAGSDQQVSAGVSVALDPATYVDAGAADTHRALVVWGDGSHDEGMVDQEIDTVSQSHIYVKEGIFVVTVIVVDDDGGFGVDTFTAKVGSPEPGDNPPVAVVDTYTVPANQTLTIDAPGVLVNDASPSGNPLTAILVDDVSNGSLDLKPDGSFIYTPGIAFTGVDFFTYKANEGRFDSNVTTVIILVTGIPLELMANDDFFTTETGQVLTVEAPGVLANDTSPSGNPLTATLVDDTSNGLLDLGLNGSFTYIPDPGFVGVDSFAYKFNDGVEDSNEATVRIRVGSVVLVRPVAQPRVLSGRELVLEVQAENVQDLAGAQFVLDYDPDLFSFVVAGIGADFADPACASNFGIDHAQGTLSLAVACTEGRSGTSLVLWTVTLDAEVVEEPTDTQLVVSEVVLANDQIPSLPIPGDSASTTVKVIPPGVCGDLNADALVNIVDAIISLQITAELIVPDPIQSVLGDVVRDGEINIFDVISTIQYIVGVRPTFGVCGP